MKNIEDALKGYRDGSYQLEEVICFINQPNNSDVLKSTLESNAMHCARISQLQERIDELEKPANNAALVKRVIKCRAEQGRLSEGYILLGDVEAALSAVPERDGLEKKLKQIMKEISDSGIATSENIDLLKQIISCLHPGTEIKYSYNVSSVIDRAPKTFNLPCNNVPLDETKIDQDLNEITSPKEILEVWYYEGKNGRPEKDAFDYVIRALECRVLTISETEDINSEDILNHIQNGGEVVDRMGNVFGYNEMFEAKHPMVRIHATGWKMLVDDQPYLFLTGLLGGNLKKYKPEPEALEDGWYWANYMGERADTPQKYKTGLWMAVEGCPRSKQENWEAVEKIERPEQ